MKKSVLFADKSTTGGAVKSKITSNQELSEELHEPVTKKFKKRKVYSSFKGNIWVLILWIRY